MWRNSQSANQNTSVCANHLVEVACGKSQMVTGLSMRSGKRLKKNTSEISFGLSQNPLSPCKASEARRSEKRQARVSEDKHLNGTPVADSLITIFIEENQSNYFTTEPSQKSRKINRVLQFRFSQSHQNDVQNPRREKAWNRRAETRVLKISIERESDDPGRKGD